MIFYKWEPGDPLPDEPLPPDIQVSFWQPRTDGLPPPLFVSRINQIWWLIDRMGLFARPDLTVIALHRDGLLLHHLMVSPKWYRFPDMGADDLQLGGLWTDPAARGQGLARSAVIAAHRKFNGQCNRMWYLVDENNQASRRLIEKLGYRQLGRGERTKRFGLRLLGQFKLAQR